MVVLKQTEESLKMGGGQISKSHFFGAQYFKISISYLPFP